MNDQTRSFVPAFTGIPSWADRIAHYRTTDHLGGCLLSIRKEAKASGELDWFWACEYALETGGDLSDVDFLIAAEDEAEAERARPCDQWGEPLSVFNQSLVHPDDPSQSKGCL